MNIENQRMRGTEDDGRQSSGFTWREYRRIEEYPGSNILNFLGFGVGFFTLVMLYGLISLSKTTISISFVLLCVLLLFMVTIRLKKPKWFFDSMIVFDSYGQIATGTSDDAIIERKNYIPRMRRLPYKISDISSIQMLPMKNQGGGQFRFYRLGYNPKDETGGWFAYSIIIYFKSGEEFLVGKNFEEYEARIVSTQLNISLNEMRAVATIPPDDYKFDEQLPPAVPAKPFFRIYG